MIRDCVKNIIFDSLNYEIFRFEDFEIRHGGNSYNTISIRYDKYFYTISVNDYEMDCEISFSPGVLLDQETITMSLSQFESKIEHNIHRWLARVKRDMYTPLQQRFVTKQLEEFKKDIEEKLKDLDDSNFSAEEGAQLQQKLEELKSNFIQQSEQNDEIRKEIEKLKSEIDFLKNTINTISKKRWLKNALTKFLAWSQKKENQKLIKTGFEAVKQISQIDFQDIK